jgi:hypothetical protein
LDFLTFKGDLHLAIEFYHKALSLKADDSFTATMLGKALSQMSGQNVDYVLGSSEEFQDNEENEYSSQANVAMNMI